MIVRETEICPAQLVTENVVTAGTIIVKTVALLEMMTDAVVTKMTTIVEDQEMTIIT